MLHLIIMASKEINPSIEHTLLAYWLLGIKHEMTYSISNKIPFQSGGTAAGA